MANLPDRKTLVSMRRADLQKLCKDRGLKANLKSEELIDLLLETSKPPEQPRQAPRSSSMRVVSRAAAAPTTRGRVGSMIVHEPEDDEGPAEDADIQQHSRPTSHDPNPLGPATRRKAKETQYKLGVGRPTAIGGTGPRAVTTSATKPRSKRGTKASASVQPTELAIREEEEESDPMEAEEASAPQAGPSGTVHTASPPAPFVSDKLRSYVSDIVEPLKVQLATLQDELRRATQFTFNIDALQSSISQLTNQITTLEARDADRSRLIETMREELSALKLSRPEPSGHTRMESGKSGAAESNESGTAVASSTNSPPKSSLGKRQRGSNESVTPGQGSGNGQGPLRPSRKKAKLTDEGDEVTMSYEADEMEEEESEHDENAVEMAEHPKRAAGFTVFSGPDEDQPDSAPFSDGPPPTTRLSDLFAFPAVTPPNGATPSASTTTHGAENRAPATGNAFSFSFANSIFRPMTSTPAVGRSPPGIPQPEPPTSPSPAGPGGSLVGIGRPPPRPHTRALLNSALASSSRASAVPSADDPSALTQTPALPSVPEESSISSDIQQSKVASNLARNLGMGLPGMVPLPMPPDTPGPPIKRTMYGTELDVETRFGDFGMEGVAMGFWTGTAPRC